MNIFVCIKQAFDWNTSSKDFRIDPATNQVKVSFARYCIDQYDELAREVARRYRDVAGGEVRALTVGPEEADDVLRHAHAMKVNHATLVERNEGDASTADLVSAAVRHYGGGIVLCGRISSDNGTGQTGPVVAQLLGMPFVSNVVHIEGAEGNWACRRETPDGYETVRLSRPFVASVTNADTLVARAPSLKDVMLAHRARSETLQAAALCPANAGEFSPRTRVVRRFVPSTSRACQRLEGTTQEQASALAQYIRTACAKS
jgi:electron transfer flavoprotein beta subunit